MGGGGGGGDVQSSVAGLGTHTIQKKKSTFYISLYRSILEQSQSILAHMYILGFTFTYVRKRYNIDYRIAENFRGVQFSWIGHSESFRGHSRPNAHPYRHIKKSVGLILWTHRDPRKQQK